MITDDERLAGDHGRYPLSSEAPWQFATLTEDLTPGSSAKARISTMSVSGVGYNVNDVVVHDMLLRTGDQLDSGTLVVIFRHWNNRYYVLGAQCP